MHCQQRSLIKSGKTNLIYDEPRSIIIYTSALVNPRRDEKCGHTNPQPIEPEVEGVRTDDPVGVGHIRHRRRDMVVEPAVLIVGDEQCSLVPLRARPERLVHLLHQLLPHRHIVGRVVVVPGEHLHIEVPLLDHNIVGQLPEPGVELEHRLVAVELHQVL